MSTSDAAELSSLITAVEDLLARVEAITGRYEGSKRDDLLGELYQAERALKAGARRLTTAQSALR